MMNRNGSNNPDLRNPLPNGCILRTESGKEYQILAVLGRGGFAYTYRALLKSNHTIFAIKEFLPQNMVVRDAGTMMVRIKNPMMYQSYEYSRKRFEHEAKTIARFQSDSIVRVHEDFSTNNTHYMVMEYLEGETLKQYLSRHGVMEERYIRPLGGSLCLALSTIHKHGMIHRDLALDNIILKEDMNGLIIDPKILDFGSARFLGSDYNETYHFVKAGYSAPEQYTKITPDYDMQQPWTDIYELGAILYTCTTGKPPVDAMTRKNSIISGQADPLIPPINFNASISYELNDIIMKAMAYDPRWRFESAEQFRLALVGVEGDPNPDGGPDPLRQFLRKMKDIAGPIAGIALITLFVILGFSRFLDPVIPSADVSIWYVSDEDGEKEQILNDIINELGKERRFRKVEIELTGFSEDEYQEALNQAYQDGNLPSLFESIDVNENYMDGTILLDEVYPLIKQNSCYFIDDNKGRLFSSNRVPISFSVPVIYVRRNFINEEDSTMLKMNGVASCYDLMQLNDGDTTSWDYAIDDDSYLRKKYSRMLPDFLDVFESKKRNLIDPGSFMAEEVGVYLSSTDHYQDVMSIIQSGNGDVIFASVNSEDILCKYTNYWSIGEGETDEENAAKAILAYFYSNNAQIRFSMNESWTGVPLEKNAFDNFIKINDRLSGVLENVDRFIVGRD